MAVFFSGSHILLHHFHLLCLWGFDPQYSRLSYTHALQGEPVGIVPNGNPILVESFLSPLKKLLSLVTEFSKDAEQKVMHKDTILCSFNESNLLPLHSLKDTLLDNGALSKPSSIKGVTLNAVKGSEKCKCTMRVTCVYVTILHRCDIYIFRPNLLMFPVYEWTESCTLWERIKSRGGVCIISVKESLGVMNVGHWFIVSSRLPHSDVHGSLLS